MNERASDPERLVDLDEGGFSSMGSDLRVARSSGPTYDVDAGLMRFSALVAVAPVAAVIGTTAVANAAPAGAGALAPGALAPAALGAGGTVATSAATSAAVTTAGTSAVTATGTAAKLAVAAKLGFGMKTIAAAMIATGAIGVAGYEVVSSPAPREQAARVADERTQMADGPRRAPAPFEAPRPLEARPIDAPPPVEAPTQASAPTVDVVVEPPVAPIDAPSEPPAVVAPVSNQPASAQPASAQPASAQPASAQPATAASTALARGAPTANGAVPSSVKPEMEQLAKVRSAGDPSLQLRLAQDGHRLFPRGVFFQEREAIAIDALSRLGRSGEASERARAYVSRYPKSPYVETFRRIAGE